MEWWYGSAGTEGVLAARTRVLDDHTTIKVILLQQQYGSRNNNATTNTYQGECEDAGEEEWEAGVEQGGWDDQRCKLEAVTPAGLGKLCSKMSNG